MSGASHSDVVNKVIDILKSMDLYLYGLRPSDVHESDFPFLVKPPVGLLVTRTIEREGDGLNQAMDVAYPVQILRSGHTPSHQAGDKRSGWREVVWGRFNHTRLGLSQELMTKCEFLEIQYDNALKSHNVDASGLRVVTWVRKKV